MLKNRRFKSIGLALIYSVCMLMRSQYKTMIFFETVSLKMKKIFDRYNPINNGFNFFKYDTILRHVNY